MEPKYKTLYKIDPKNRWYVDMYYFIGYKPTNSTSAVYVARGQNIAVQIPPDMEKLIDNPNQLFFSSEIAAYMQVKDLLQKELESVNNVIRELTLEGKNV